jgi:excisionase family DNA binding protein
MNKAKQLNKPDTDEYLTVDEAANELGIKTNAIRNYLYLGKLTTHKFKNLTLLDANEINNWKSRQK